MGGGFTRKMNKGQRNEGEEKGQTLPTGGGSHEHVQKRREGEKSTRNTQEKGKAKAKGRKKKLLRRRDKPQGRNSYKRKRGIEGVARKNKKKNIRASLIGVGDRGLVG